MRPTDASPLGTRRIVAYALLLTVVGGFCCFHRLSEGTLFGDEAAFAFTTERMRDTGDWVVPYLGDQPHLNAVPLYNWLTLAIAPGFDETPLWHRFVAGVFGVGCVLMAFALGTLLFRAEVGFLAGLCLAFNRDFLFCHGVRFGGMESITAFFITAAAFCYAWIRTRSVRGMSAWCVLGLCIGLAWLSKPPVFGSFFLVVIGLHHLAVSREPLTRRALGPLLAAAVGVVVAAPWYVAMWMRLGNPFLHALFVHNAVERAIDPGIRDYLCCHNAILHSSFSFKLIEAAFACALGCCIVNHRRTQWALLLTLAGSFLLALSTAGKAFQYIFYSFPLLSVILAGLFLESGPRLVERYWPGRTRFATIAFVGLAVALLAADCQKILRTIAMSAWVHPPVGIYERLESGLAEGRCRFVLFDIGSPVRGVSSSGRGMTNFEDLYYGRRMPLADWVSNVEDLKRLLEDGKPTIVLLPPLTSLPQPRLEGLTPETRIEDNLWPAYTYPTLTFHGAAAEFSAGELIRLCRAGER
jgi:4-amino-4-deoxy-L-arabinose transferase-like glycosyltransferase